MSPDGGTGDIPPPPTTCTSEFSWSWGDSSCPTALGVFSASASSPALAGAGSRWNIDVISLVFSLTVSSTRIGDGRLARLNPPLMKNRVWFCLSLFLFVLKSLDSRGTGFLSGPQITCVLIWDTQLSLLVLTTLHPSTGHWTRSFETPGFNPFGRVITYY